MVLRLLLIITILWGLLTSTTLAAESFELTRSEKSFLNNHPNLSIAFDGEFPPYSYIDDNGEITGLAVDVMKRIESMLDVSFNIHPKHTWNELYADAQTGQVDMVATMVKRPERQTDFLFTRPYIYNSLVLVTRNDDDRIQHRSHLLNKSIALVRGYHYVDNIIEDNPTATPVFVDSLYDALIAVSTGKADATITYFGAAHHYRTRYLMTNLRFADMYAKDASLESIAVHRDLPQLRNIIDRALGNISNQEMQEMAEKWLPLDILQSLQAIQLTDRERAWIDNHPVIRLGVDPEFAPFEFMEDGEYKGMASDYIRLLNQRLNLNMQVVAGMEWGEVIDAAKKQKIDVLPAVARSNERETYLRFTAPYLNFFRVIITRNDMNFITGLDSLYGQNIAVQVDTSHHAYLTENTDINPLLYSSLEDALKAVSSGQADAFIGNVSASVYWIQKLNLGNLKVAAPVSNDIQSLQFAVRNDWPELVGILQKGLDSISTREQLEIAQRWTQIEYEPQRDYSLILQIALAFSGLLAAVLYWNFMLKRAVTRRSAEVMQHAYYDPLTGLANRRFVYEKLHQEISQAHGRELAVLSLDIDDFSSINNSHGHKIGDQLLKAIARRLERSLHDNMQLGRLSGDQFAIIVSPISSTDDAVAIADDLMNLIQQPLVLDKEPFQFTASIGISVFPLDGRAADVLIQSSDSALHHAKRVRKGSYSFFTGRINDQVYRQVQLQGEIRDALRRHEFSVAYQPKIASADGSITGFEALLRWENRRLGRVSPDEFIPIAERTGQIGAIGLFVARTALSFVAQINRQTGQRYSIAVNISPRQLEDGDFAIHIQNLCKKVPIDPELVELEITEGLLISASDALEQQLNLIQQSGIGLAMDDFGTGYSSLSYLRRFQFDTLKIDREFIQDVHIDKSDQQLVIAAIAMARSMGMKVVAEGVELIEQQKFLSEQGCDLQQGYYFSPPIPEAAVEQWLLSQPDFRL